MSNTANLIREQRQQDLQLLKKILLYCLGGSAIAHAVMLATGTLWWSPSSTTRDSNEPIEVVIFEDTTISNPEPIEPTPPEAVESVAPAESSAASSAAPAAPTIAAAPPETAPIDTAPVPVEEPVLEKVGGEPTDFTVSESDEDTETSDKAKAPVSNAEGSEAGSTEGTVNGSGVGPISTNEGGFGSGFGNGMLDNWGVGGDESGDGSGDGGGRLRNPVNPVSPSGGRPSAPPRNTGDSGSGSACAGNCEGTYQRDDEDTVERDPLIRARRNEDGELEFELIESSGSEAADRAALDTARRADYTSDRDEFTIRARVADEGSDEAEQARQRVRQQQERVRQATPPPAPTVPETRTAGESYEPAPETAAPASPPATSYEEPPAKEPINPPAPAPVNEEPAPAPEPVAPAPEPVYEEPAPAPAPPPAPVYEEPAYTAPAPPPAPVYEEPAYTAPPPAPVYEKPAYIPPPEPSYSAPMKK